MKKVLIIIYYWPPTGGSGVQRWVKFVKHLHSFGWEPVIYTPQNPVVQERDESLLNEIPPNIEVIKAPVTEVTKYFGNAAAPGSDNVKPSLLSRLKKTVGNYVRGNYFIPDPRMLWVKPSVKVLSKYLQQNKIDAIVSSGPPHSMHLIARQLSTKFAIPWLADFRDPWMEILNFHGFHTSESTVKKHQRLFDGVIKSADAVVVAHQSIQEKFKQQTIKPVELITNGYDAADFIGIAPAAIDKSKFNLVFVGIFYDILNSTAFWQGLSELLNENADFKSKLRITFVGKVQQLISGDIAKFGLAPYCHFTGYLSHNAAVAYEKAADALLLFTPQQQQFRYVIPGKLFEYLAVQKPILCIAEANNDSAVIVKQCNAGFIVPTTDVKAVKQILANVFNGYQMGTLQVSTADFEKYERRQLTAHLSAILNSISSK